MELLQQYKITTYLYDMLLEVGDQKLNEYIIVLNNYFLSLKRFFGLKDLKSWGHHVVGGGGCSPLH
jgi:hypothetical protein